jgi:hypothetical protein
MGLVEIFGFCIFTCSSPLDPSVRDAQFFFFREGKALGSFEGNLNILKSSYVAKKNTVSQLQMLLDEAVTVYCDWPTKNHSLLLNSMRKQ